MATRLSTMLFPQTKADCPTSWTRFCRCRYREKAIAAAVNLLAKARRER